MGRGPLSDTLQRIFSFEGGGRGPWHVLRQASIRGEGLPPAERLGVGPLNTTGVTGKPVWRLKGQISNLRYAYRDEVARLRSRQEGLGRPHATRAALIPIRKSTRWWELAQDERRAVFEEQSHHTRIGLQYLPGVARQLFHARDLGEPFDFITWFEFAPEHEGAFDDLLEKLRATHEWEYVERETEIRLQRNPT